MRLQSSWARGAIGSVMVAVCAAACADVLDIQDPKTRTNDAGAAGDVTEPGGAGTATGGSSSGSATVPGGAGQGGDAVPGGAGNGAAAGAGGEGGTATGECEPDAARCGGDGEKSPEICDETGHWIANSGEAEGECAVACLEGKCTECENGETRCTPCADDAVDCDTNQPQKCVAGVWTDEGDACEQFCAAGSCETAPSCDAASKPRTTCSSSESCCNSRLVPGGTFDRFIEDDSETSYPATVSPFYLDKFEVTIGRMRQFVNAFEQLKPAFSDGAGKSAHIAEDTGWSINYTLPADQAALLGEFNACSETTWSDTPGKNDDLPVNCVTFNVAYAFCIWDGGRLPTEAEWEFAAAGGVEGRAYPWKAPAAGPAITSNHANYDLINAGPIAPGSKPMGNGRWGQADLAGNVGEWMLDYYGDYPSNCTDCVNAVVTTSRPFRGGAYLSDPYFALASTRDSFEPLAPRPFIGFRCARDLE